MTDSPTTSHLVTDSPATAPVTDFAPFILANTEIVAPPLVPELRLRLATEIVPLWQETEAVLEQLNVAPPYWAFCWPGGQALARYLLDHPELVQRRRVLDCAAGSGVVAIAAARTGAQATANDVDAMALAAIGLNAELNAATVEGDGNDLLAGLADRWDLILAGDVCYERGMAERVWAWLRRAAQAGVEVLLADPGRSYLPTAGLQRLAAYTVPTSLDLEDRTHKETTIWRVL